MGEKRKALIEFCDDHVCFDCPLGVEGHKCGAGYSFGAGIDSPGYITDAEVEEAYEKAFPNGVESDGDIKPMREYCAKCTNLNRCGFDRGFRDECNYDGTGIPSEFIPVGVRDSMEPKDIPSPREEILREAIKCVCTDRNRQYGEPEDNFDVIAGFWETYLGCPVTERMVADMMILLKIGRAVTADVQKKDTYIDIAGYAACAGGMIENG